MTYTPRFGSGTQHAAVEDTATTDEQSAAFDVNFVHYIVNDGSEDLLLNFSGQREQDDMTAAEAADRFTLKSGESIEGMSVDVRRLYYKAASGTVAFRALGVR